MPLMFDGMGAEALADEVYLALRDRLNDEILRQQQWYNAYDQQRAVAFGVPYVPIVVEPIEPENFHVGSLPNFVTSNDREGDYPLCAVVPGRSVPDGENASADQFDVYNNVVVVHVFAKARMTDEEGHDLVYRRVMRMAEAVHKMTRSDRELRAKFAGIAGPTLAERSEPWEFPAEDGHGDDWVWRAVMLQYQVKNYSQTPMEV